MTDFPFPWLDEHSVRDVIGALSELKPRTGRAPGPPREDTDDPVGLAVFLLSYAYLRKPDQPAHTLTMGDVDDGMPGWKLHCNHDMATWGSYDPETGEYSENDGCWLMSWWDGVGADLLDLKAPIPDQPIPVRPSNDWDTDGGTIVLDLGHRYAPAGDGTNVCAHDGCGRHPYEHEPEPRR